MTDHLEDAVTDLSFIHYALLIGIWFQGRIFDTVGTMCKAEFLKTQTHCLNLSALSSSALFKTKILHLF